MKTTRNLLCITIALSVWSCSPTGTSRDNGAQPMQGQGVAPIPDGPIPQEDVVLTLEGSVVQDPTAREWEQIQVRLSNRSGRALGFTGYDETQPWYRIQRFIDSKWVDHQVGWYCGTGLRQCKIPSGMSSIIPVSVRKDLYPIRVGVTYSLGAGKAESQTVWSARIDAR